MGERAVSGIKKITKTCKYKQQKTWKMLFKQLNYNNYNHKSKFNSLNVIYLGTYRKSYYNLLIRQCNTTSVISNHKLLTLNDLKILKLSYKLIVCKLQTKNYLKLTNTFTNTQNKWFINLSFKLKTGNFTYLIIESSKNFKLENLKLLRLGKLRNNIVNQALELILEIFYEPLFLSTSHGFRPFKGCHSALKQIQF